MVDSRHVRKITYKASTSNTPLQTSRTRQVILSTRPACLRQNAVFCAPLPPRQRAASGIQNGGYALGWPPANRLHSVMGVSANRHAHNTRSIHEAVSGLRGEALRSLAANWLAEVAFSLCAWSSWPR